MEWSEFCFIIFFLNIFNFNIYYKDLNCGVNLPFICEKLKTDAADTNTFVQPLSFGDGRLCSEGYSAFGGSFKYF